MSEARITRFSSWQILSLFTFGSAALLMTGVLPVLLGSLIEAGVVDLAGAGRLASLETVALGIGVAIATTVFPLDAFRRIGMISTLALAAANLMSAFSTGIEQLVVCRIASGFSAGVMLWIVTSIMVRTAQPERLAGYFMAGYTLLQSLVVIALAVTFIPEYGWRACFFVVAAVALLPALFSAGVPAKLKPLPRLDLPAGPLSPLVFIAGLVVFFQVAMTITIWAFLDPIGRATGASAQSIQYIVSVSLIVQVVGAAVAGLTAPRTPVFFGLIGSTVLTMFVALYMFNVSRFDPALFLPMALVFSFVWMYMLPFQFKFAIEIDSSGRLALQIPAIQIAGGAIAPTAAGLVAGGGPATGVALFSLWGGIFVLIAIVVSVILQKRST